MHPVESLALRAVVDAGRCVQAHTVEYVEALLLVDCHRVRRLRGFESDRARGGLVALRDRELEVEVGVDRSLHHLHSLFEIDDRTGHDLVGTQAALEVDAAGAEFREPVRVGVVGLSLFLPVQVRDLHRNGVVRGEEELDREHATRLTSGADRRDRLEVGVERVERTDVEHRKTPWVW